MYKNRYLLKKFNEKTMKKKKQACERRMILDTWIEQDFNYNYTNNSRETTNHTLNVTIY